MPDTPQDSPPAPTEGVEPVDINKILLWWQGQYTPAEHHQRFTDAKAAIERLIAEARIEERELMSKTFFEADRDELPIERIYAIHLDRLAQLNQMKGKTK